MSTTTTWTDRAQGIGSIIASIGVIAAVWFSAASLKDAKLSRDLTIESLEESKVSRELTIRPLVAFDYTPQIFRAEVTQDGLKIVGAKGGFIHGLHSTLIAQELDPYGKLMNYGNGAALEVAVSFRSIDDTSPGVADPLGHPSVPSHILPQQSAQLNFLPPIVTGDKQRHRHMLLGTVIISYKNAAMQTHELRQDYSCFYEPEDDQKHVKLTLRFSGVKEIKPAR